LTIYNCTINLQQKLHDFL